MAAPLNSLFAPSDLRRTSLCREWGLPLPPPPPGRRRRSGTPPPPVLEFPPPPSATVRGHRAPPGPHACGTGKRHVPTYALAHGRRLAGGRRADLRDPSHGGGTASDARPGRGVGLASFLGGALGIRGGGGGGGGGLLLLRCGDIEPHPGPMRVALANVTSLRMHWHTVAD